MDVGGRWTSAELVIELTVTGTLVSGAIEMQGMKLPVRAQIQGALLVGQFEAQGHAFPFAARRDGDALLIESDGVAYRLTRAETPRAPAPVNPLAALRATPAPAPAGDTTVYRHATGGELDLPRGWQVTQSQLGLQLVPPDAAYNAMGPAELYLLNQAPAPGIARAEDPRVVAHVDAGLRQLVPMLALDGGATPCGPGARVRWRGQHPQTGAPIAAVALLRMDVAASALIAIIALGEQPRVDARLAALEAIFGSFRRGEGQRDPALVGVWHHWSYKGSSSAFTGYSLSSESRRTAQLGPDGSYIERSSHEGSVSVPAGGYASQSSDGRTGTWTAGDGMLYVQFSDGATGAWHYQLSGTPGSRRLMLQAPGAREPMEWNERPISV